MNGGTLHIRVYYQDNQNIIRELSFDSAGWFAGHSFPAGMQATSIACTTVPREGYWHWLFYQKPDTKFGGYVMANASQWRDGKPLML